MCTSVRRRPGRCEASSKANRTQRSTPMRVFTEPWVATSCGVPRRRNPPSPAYVPSVFSRTTTKSQSGAGAPGVPTKGRRFTYRSSSKRSRSNSPRSSRPGGTSVEPTGGPTAPRRMASKPRSSSSVASGRTSPVRQVVGGAELEGGGRQGHSRRAHDLQRLGHHLGADPVAADDGHSLRLGLAHPSAAPARSSPALPSSSRPARGRAQRHPPRRRHPPPSSGAPPAGTLAAGDALPGSPVPVPENEKPPTLWTVGQAHTGRRAPIR